APTPRARGEPPRLGARPVFAHRIPDVLQTVVLPAQQPQVLEAGRAAVGPVHDVMRLAIGRTTGTAGFGAVPVARDERIPERGSHRPRGPPDVDHLARTVGEDPADLAVAQDAL